MHRCCIKDFPTNNQSCRTLSNTKFPSIPRVSKTHKYSNNRGIKNKFYCLKSKVLIEKRKQCLKSVSANYPIGSKSL